MITWQVISEPRATLPLFAMKISAGPPVTAEDYIDDRIDLSEYLAPHPETSFLIRAEGESMLDAGIHPGDLLVVEQGVEARNGDIVIAEVSDGFTVKRFRQQRGHLWLVSANKDFPAPKYERFAVWGIVRFSIHKL